MAPHKTTSLLDPAIIVIFGITGDLSKRKLLPALYHLFKDSLLNENTVILGISRKRVSVDEVLKDIELCINEIDGLCDQDAVQKLRDKLQMMQLDISDDTQYDSLLEALNTIETKHGMCMNRLYYLSIPPQVTGPIISALGQHGLNSSCQHGVASTRLLIEKPFGYNLISAQELIKVIEKQFKEEQLFRIDHYVAKETVQNIITFRSNNIFEKLWSKEYISHVTISAFETIGIEGRTIFYEQVGALRDIIQSHLLQLLAIVTLDLPETTTSETLHRAKLKLLQQIMPIPPMNVDRETVRGQYKTYRQETSNSLSITETFAAVALKIDENRWQDVPFILSTGKALSKKSTEIRVTFKPFFAGAPSNVLVFRLQPNEGIELSLLVKKPGFENEMQPAIMDFSYQQTFTDHGHPDAYERVLVDAIKGDHTLFATSNEVLAAWRVIESVLHGWEQNSNTLQLYNNGTDGPQSFRELLQRYKVEI